MLTLPYLKLSILSSLPNSNIYLLTAYFIYTGQESKVNVSKTKSDFTKPLSKFFSFSFSPFSVTHSPSCLVMKFWKHPFDSFFSHILHPVYPQKPVSCTFKIYPVSTVPLKSPSTLINFFKNIFLCKKKFSVVKGTSLKHTTAQ